MLFIGLIIALSAFYLDQATKYLASKHLMLKDKKLFKGHLVLTYLENKGGMMGIFHKHYYLLLIISIVGTIILSYLILPNHVINNFDLCGASYMLILGGAAGNLTDRIIFRYVVDFFYFKGRKKTTVVFNLADFFIFGGTLGFIIGEIIYGF